MRVETIDLLASIHDFVVKINKKKASPLSQKQEVNISNSLAEFCERATEKFIAGQIEHGGLLENRDLREERSKEILDLFWYNEAEIWKSDKF